jgi:2-dehydropantoate 2-reductase
MPGSVAIVGCGAIGGLAGFYMAQAGEQVTFIDQNAEHVQAIRERGISVNGVYGPMEIGPQPAFTPDQVPGALSGLVFVACKSQATEGAINGVLKHLTPTSCVVSLQNGMNERRIAAVVGLERTMGAIPDYGGAYLDPGVLEAVHEGTVYVGEIPGGITGRAREAGRLLGIGPNKCDVLDDIMGRVWTKHVYSSHVLVDSLVDGTAVEVLGDQRVQLLGGAAVREAMKVAEAAGVTLQRDQWFNPDLYHVETPADTERLLASYRRLAEHLGGHQRTPAPGGYQYVKKTSGIQWDIVYRRRKSEAQYVSVALEAKDYGISVPLNDRILEMIGEIEDGKRQLGWHNITELTEYAERLGLALPATR